MLTKEIRTEIDGHQVRVVNSNLSGEAKLYIDGDCRDSSTEIMSLGRSPLLSSSIDGTAEKTVIEVYFKNALFGLGIGLKIKILANGRFVAGDDF